MSHGVNDSKSDVGESHACHILSKRHVGTAFWRILYSGPKRAGNDFNGFDVEHIGKFPCACGNVSFDGMSQGIHSGGGCQALWHAGHHIRVNDGNDRDVMGIYAYEFAALFYVGNDIVDGNLGSSAGSGRNRDDRN